MLASLYSEVIDSLISTTKIEVTMAHPFELLDIFDKEEIQKKKRRKIPAWLLQSESH